MDFPLLLRGASAPPPRRLLIRAGLAAAGLAALAGSASLVSWGPVARSAGALAFVILLAFAALRLGVRRAGARGAPELRVVSRASLAPRNGVALLETGGRRYLVAFGDGFTVLLAKQPIRASSPEESAP